MHAKLNSTIINTGIYLMPLYFIYMLRVRVCVCVCVCVCMRACVRACGMRACVRYIPMKTLTVCHSIFHSYLTAFVPKISLCSNVDVGHEESRSATS